MNRRLDDVRLAVMTIGGIELKGHTNVVALEMTTDGLNLPLRALESTNPRESMIECRAALGPRRQALVGRHLPALDRRRRARGGAPVPVHHRLRRCHQARHRYRARARSATVPTATEEGVIVATARASHRDRRRSSTTSGTSSSSVAWPTGCGDPPWANSYVRAGRRATGSDQLNRPSTQISTVLISSSFSGPTTPSTMIDSKP
jgi:hypothetical protein